MENEVTLNIEDMEKLNRNCGDCGTELTEENRSGWYAFFGGQGDIQIEVCITCNNNRGGGPTED